MSNKASQITISATPIVVVLIILKAFGKIDIAWKWIFAPLWLPFAIWLTFVSVFLFLALIFGITVTKTRGK